MYKIRDFILFVCVYSFHSIERCHNQHIQWCLLIRCHTCHTCIMRMVIDQRWDHHHQCTIPIFMAQCRECDRHIHFSGRECHQIWDFREGHRFGHRMVIYKKNHSDDRQLTVNCLMNVADELYCWQRPLESLIDGEISTKFDRCHWHPIKETFWLNFFFSFFFLNIYKQMNKILIFLDEIRYITYVWSL